MIQLLLKLLGLLALALAVAAGCAGGNSGSASLTGQCAQDCEPTTSATPATASAPALGSATPPAAGAFAADDSATALATPTASRGGQGFAPATVAASPAGCDAATIAGNVIGQLTRSQLVGQLFMVGLSSDDDPQTALATIANSNAGNVVLYGSGWDSADRVRRAAAAIRAEAEADNQTIDPFIAGNQEGGADGTFQAFYGPGFDEIPSALQQGQLPPTTLTAEAQVWGQQLRAAGVNLDLAPVLDVVDRATARQNGPIGQYDREFGYDPATVAAHGVAFIQGMHAAGEPVAIKHFPGLGRVQGNTDFTAEGTSDTSFSGAGDPNLQPFAAGIQAGAEMMMVSSATYPLVDDQPAVFSSAIVDGILRGKLGFTGVVISDDLGAAAAVADVRPADRAVRFFAAGGDMLLTVNPADIAPMSAAVLQRMQSDATFADRIQQAALRVLTLKARAGLLPGTPVCATPAPAQGRQSSGR